MCQKKTEIVAAKAATFKDNKKPEIISLSFIKALYQLPVKPRQIMSCDELLNEKIINTKIGVYKKR